MTGKETRLVLTGEEAEAVRFALEYRKAHLNELARGLADRGKYKEATKIKGMANVCHGILLQMAREEG